ncbi:MAG: hypothetical protein ACKVS5_10065 [Parvularculaceae bacterium]
MGTTIELALAALFDLCIPAVSEGLVAQTFPSELVLPLTESEKEEYREALGEENWRISSDDGFILLIISAPYCAVVTADGMPREARSRFLKMLETRKGRVTGAEKTTDDPELISAEIDFDEKSFASIVFTIGLEPSAQGFYGSASKWGKKEN